MTTTGVDTAITSATFTNILTSPTIPIGVWRIDFSVKTTASVAGTISLSRSVVSATNATSAIPVSFTGSSMRSVVSEVYGTNEIQLINSSFTYNQSTAGVLYLNIHRTFTTGTYAFLGELSITRLA